MTEPSALTLPEAPQARGRPRGLVIEDGATVTTTEVHSFWNATDQQWQQAQHLDPGDRLLTARGHAVPVAGLRTPTAYTTTAYNLTIRDIHTYYVQAGDANILVHSDSLLCETGADGWPIPNGNNCEACAKIIKYMIGGDIVFIKDGSGAPQLGPSKHDPDGTWFDRYAVVKDGRVYDGCTGTDGMLFDDYRDQWRYGDYLSFRSIG